MGVMAAFCAVALLGGINPPSYVHCGALASAQEESRLTRRGDVLFADSFSSPKALDWYFEVRGKGEGRAVIDEGALRLTAINRNGAASGAGVSYWFGDRPQKRVHLRYRIKWAENYDQGNLNHTGGGLTGLASNGKWDEMGKAGIKPKGDDRISVGVDSWVDWGRIAPPGYLFCYTYWMEMKRDRDGSFWGNFLGPAEADRLVPRRGAWYWIELMISLNDVGTSNGELALWVNGKLNFHHTGIRWRSSEALMIKRMGLDVYIHQCRQDNTVWYDDVVLSTGFVGIP